MENCIFCKIVKGEIPADKIYEDKDFLAFLDIRPVSHGHILIIPKEHIIWMQDVSDEMISKIFAYRIEFGIFELAINCSVAI